MYQKKKELHNNSKRLIANSDQEKKMTSCYLFYLLERGIS